MKYFKLFMAITGAFLWCAFAVFMNDMNSASDKDHSTGLARLAFVGVLASLWLVFWVGLSWFRHHEARLSWHLTVVVAILWTNSLVLEISLPWLGYLAGWMWPNAMTVGLQALLTGIAVFLHFRIYGSTAEKVSFLHVSLISFIVAAVISIYVHLIEFSHIHELPYQTKIFMQPTN
jgi:uncharacterized membrane protein YsdA (DUF1294 family)